MCRPDPLSISICKQERIYQAHHENQQQYNQVKHAASQEDQAGSDPGNEPQWATYFECESYTLNLFL